MNNYVGQKPAAFGTYIQKGTPTPMPTQQDTGKKPLSKKKKILIAVIIIVVLAVAGVLIWWFTRPAAPGGVQVVNEDNLEAIGDQSAEKINKATFELYMNTRWTFSDGGLSPSSNAVIGNAAANNYDFTFTVTVPELDDKLVYTSQVVPVGAQLKELVLDEALPPGEYEAVVSYYLVDEKGAPVESNLGFAVTLQIKS